MTEKKKKEEKGTAANKEKVSRRRVLEGLVVKRGSDKTVKVEVLLPQRHALYSKRAVKSKRYLVDDPEGKAEVGQMVRIGEARSLSKRKKYRLLEQLGSKVE